MMADGFKGFHFPSVWRQHCCSSPPGVPAFRVPDEERAQSDWQYTMNQAVDPFVVYSGGMVGDGAFQPSVYNIDDQLLDDISLMDEPRRSSSETVFMSAQPCQAMPFKVPAKNSNSVKTIETPPPTPRSMGSLSPNDDTNNCVKSQLGESLMASCFGNSVPPVSRPTRPVLPIGSANRPTRSQSSSGEYQQPNLFIKPEPVCPSAHVSLKDTRQEDCPRISSEQLMASEPVNGSPEERRAFRQHLRKIRNREAAHSSRKRKKEQFEALQAQVKDLTDANDALANENSMLKQALTELKRTVRSCSSCRSSSDGQNATLQKEMAEGRNTVKKADSKGALKKRAHSVAQTVFFLGVCLVVSFLDPLPDSSTNMNPRYASPVRRGRTLLSIDRDQASDNVLSVGSDFEDIDWQSALLRSLLKNVGSKRLQLSDCNHILASLQRKKVCRLIDKGPDVARQDQHLAAVQLEEKSDDCQLVNKTQTRRIVKALNKSFWQHKKKRGSSSARKQKDKMEKNLLTTEVATVKGWDAAKRPAGRQALSLFEGVDWRFQALLKAMNRRTDTFYVVSLQDHHLFPATHVNTTRQPLMSLVMPAVLNDSVRAPAGQVSMMRIDCEVVDTAVIHVAETVVPLSDVNKSVPVDKANSDVLNRTAHAKTDEAAGHTEKRLASLPVL